MGKQIINWIYDNWVSIGSVLGGAWAAVKAIVWAYRRVNKVATPIKQFVKQHEDNTQKITYIADQLNFNGGKSVKDVVFKTSDDVEQIKGDIKSIGDRQTAMIELNDTAMFENDSEGKCVTANDAICTLFGATKNQMLGFGWLNYIEDSEEQREIWERAIETDNEISHEYVIINGVTQERIKAKYIAHIKRDDEGNILNITGKVFKLNNKK